MIRAWRPTEWTVRVFDVCVTVSHIIASRTAAPRIVLLTAPRATVSLLPVCVETAWLRGGSRALGFASGPADWRLLI